jgi:nucleoside-diphosphate-sugar epimerase
MAIAYSVQPADGPVLVTGATGYVAGWVVKYLLEAGITVHAAVRDPDNAAKIAHLVQMAEKSHGKIRFFKADLLDRGSHEEAMRGCRIVMHTASPFITKISDPQRDLVDPALQGTRDILETANRIDSVRRVVLTSSTVAVMTTGPDAFRPEPRTEADWHTSATLEKHGYAYSKVVAERAAWEIAKAQNRWKLVVVNPGFIVGPGTAPSQTSASFDHVRNMGNGTFRNGTPQAEVGTVDVRDVAESHMRAAFIEAAEGRNIVFAEVLSLNDMAQMLKKELGEERWQFPPDTPWTPELPRWRLDNSKSKRELGMEYRPLKPAIVNMFLQVYGQAYGAND